MKATRVLAVVVVLLAVASVYLTAELASARRQSRAAAVLSEEKENWRLQARQTTEQLQACQRAMKNFPILHELHLDGLKRACGSDDPVQHLTADLMRRAELIPFEGVLGGTMAFREHRIWILDSSHALAEVDDGHIGGWMLLRFEFGGGGEIAWELLS